MFAYLIEHNRFLNIIGVGVILGLCYILSKRRSSINYRLVVNALLMQIIIAVLMLRTSIGQWAVGSVAHAVKKLYEFADKGSEFMFGNLTNPTGSWGFIFAIKVLPIIVFFGALMSLLFHLGIVQRCVMGMSIVMRPLLGTAGSETLCAIANSFLGQTEAPLLIKNYLKGMTKSEIFLVMVSGMATISGAILAVFAAMGVPAQHMLTSSVMSIPGAILIAKLLYPETQKSETASGTAACLPSPSQNSIDAICAGTSDGLQLALNVGAMLISFLSLIALLNFVLAYASGIVNCGLLNAGISEFQLPILSLSLIFSYLFAPFGYLLGFTGTEALNVGQLLGTKVAINELIAYGQMVNMHLSERTTAIVTYALCGFSNFSCIGIQIGGIGALVPEKRGWLCELGIYAVLAAALSNVLSAMIVAFLI